MFVRVPEGFSPYFADFDGSAPTCSLCHACDIDDIIAGQSMDLIEMWRDNARGLVACARCVFSGLYEDLAGGLS